MKKANITTVTGLDGKTILRDYRNHVIGSYELSQLYGSGARTPWASSEPAMRGRAYSVWASHEDRKTGKDPLSASYRLDYLWEAKAFVDKLCK